jgi:hypothetical protein
LGVVSSPCVVVSPVLGVVSAVRKVICTRFGDLAVLEGAVSKGRGDAGERRNDVAGWQDGVVAERNLAS